MDDERRPLQVIISSFIAGTSAAAVYGLTGWGLFEIISIACATACLLCIGYVLGRDS